MIIESIIEIIKPYVIKYALPLSFLTGLFASYLYISYTTHSYAFNNNTISFDATFIGLTHLVEKGPETAEVLLKENTKARIRDMYFLYFHKASSSEKKGIYSRFISYKDYRERIKAYNPEKIQIDNYVNDLIQYHDNHTWQFTNSDLINDIWDWIFKILEPYGR